MPRPKRIKTGRSEIIITCHYEKDPVKTQQAMDAAMDYLCYLARTEGWFDGILPKSSTIEMPEESQN